MSRGFPGHSHIYIFIYLSIIMFVKVVVYGPVGGHGQHKFFPWLGYHPSNQDDNLGNQDDEPYYRKSF